MPNMELNRIRQWLLIQEGESHQVLYFWILFLLIGIGLAIGRATSDALFLKRYGIEYLPFIFIILSVSLAVASTLYSAVADSQLPERYLITVFSIISLILGSSWVVMVTSSSRWIYPVYYITYTMASELILVHGLYYFSQNFNTLQSKRLSPLILSGEQIGFILGGLLVTFTVPLTGAENLLLLWVLLLVLVITLTLGWHRISGMSAFYRAPRRSRHRLKAATGQVIQGFRFMRESALLRFASMALFFMVIAIYVLWYSTYRIYTDTFKSELELTIFFGGLAAVTSTLTLFTQVLVTNRAIRRFGLQHMNLVFPVTTLVALGGLILHFSLPAALFGSLNRETMLNAVQNPVRNSFLSVLPGTIQGRARAMSLILVMPAALLVCGAMLWIAQRFSSPLIFLLPGAMAAALFLNYSLRMNREYRATLISHLQDRLFVPKLAVRQQFLKDPKESLEALHESLLHRKGFTIDNAKMLLAHFPDLASNTLLAVLPHMNCRDADQVLPLVVNKKIPDMGDALVARLAGADDHLKASILKALGEIGDSRAESISRKALNDASPRFRAAALHVMLNLSLMPTRSVSIVWMTLLQGDLQERLCSLDLIPDLVLLPMASQRPLVELYQHFLQELLDGKDIDLQRSALHALHRWPLAPISMEIESALIQMLRSSDPGLRKSTVSCAPMVRSDVRDMMLSRGLEDPHPDVSGIAAKTLQQEASDVAKLTERWLGDSPRGAPRARLILLDNIIDEELSRPLLEKIAEYAVDQAAELKCAIHVVQSSANLSEPLVKLFLDSLSVRLMQTGELALRALDPFCPSGLIPVVAAAMKTGDTRFIANAYEALDSLNKLPVARRLSRLLTDVDDTKDSCGNGQVLESLDAVLVWCFRKEDPWLRTCASALRGNSSENREMNSIVERVSFLSRSAIFSKIAPDDLQLVAQAMEEEIYFKGDRVFEINDQGDHLYIVMSGSVGISISADPDDQTFISTFGPGDSFGEMNLLDDLPRSGTAHVLEDSRMLSLEKARLQGLIMSYPQLALGLLRSLSLMVREWHKRIVKI